MRAASNATRCATRRPRVVAFRRRPPPLSLSAGPLVILMVYFGPDPHPKWASGHAPVGMAPCQGSLTESRMLAVEGSRRDDVVNGSGPDHRRTPLAVSVVRRPHLARRRTWPGPGAGDGGPRPAGPGGRDGRTAERRARRPARCPRAAGSD